MQRDPSLMRPAKPGSQPWSHYRRHRLSKAPKPKEINHILGIVGAHVEESWITQPRVK